MTNNIQPIEITSPQTIIGFVTENVKKIKLVQLKPNGKTILITGANQQGKTSLVDSFWWTLGGKNAMRKTSEPIREGETEARSILEFQDFIVERRYTLKSSYLYVTLKDEQRTPVHPAQSFIDKFLGTISIDPTEILQMSPKEQVENLLKLFKVYDKVTELDGKYEGLYQKRWSIGQERDSAIGALENLEKPSEGISREEKSISDLSKKLTEAINFNNNIEQAKRQADNAQDNIVNRNRTISEWENQIKELQNKIAQAKQVNNQEQATINKIQEQIEGVAFKETVPIEEEISKVEEYNEKVREAKKYDEFQNKVNNFNEQYKELNEECEAILNQKQEILQGIKMPVEGLSIDDRGLVFGPTRRPMEQLSDSEQHLIAGKIAMAEKPTIRILRIKHGEALDDKTFEIYQKMAEENGYQLIIEKVDTSGKLGIVLEDGEVIAQNDTLTFTEVKEKEKEK
jgi:hypothetical protein